MPAGSMLNRRVFSPYADHLPGIFYYYCTCVTVGTINKETKCLRYKAFTVGCRCISRPGSMTLPKAADFFRLVAIWE